MVANNNASRLISNMTMISKTEMCKSISLKVKTEGLVMMSSRRLSSRRLKSSLRNKPISISIKGHSRVVMKSANTITLWKLLMRNWLRKELSVRSSKENCWVLQLLSLQLVLACVLLIAWNWPGTCSTNPKNFQNPKLRRKFSKEERAARKSKKPLRRRLKIWSISACYLKH